jgi:hypothetical protein
LIPYPHDPKPFLSNKEIKKEIMKVFPGDGVGKIQAQVFIDKKHVFVPYITKRNTYGIVNWIWKKNDWEIISIETNTADPKLWKIKSNNTLKFYLFWNINPKSRIHKMNFYLTRNRQFSVSDGVSKYQPKIQMKFEKKLNGRSYGVLKLPKNWETVMNDDIFINSENQSNSLFSSFEQPSSMSVSWLPLNENNKIKMPINSDSGSGYGNGENQIDFVPFVDESTLEGEDAIHSH